MFILRWQICLFHVPIFPRRYWRKIWKEKAKFSCWLSLSKKRETSSVGRRRFIKSICLFMQTTIFDFVFLSSKRKLHTCLPLLLLESKYNESFYYNHPIVYQRSLCAMWFSFLQCFPSVLKKSMKFIFLASQNKFIYFILLFTFLSPTFFLSFSSSE